MRARRLAFSIVVGVGLLLSAWRPESMLAPFQAAFVGSRLMGLVSLAFSDRVSAFETPWAWLAVLWGVAFVAASELECRKDVSR
jgi:hypothetical protein